MEHANPDKHWTEWVPQHTDDIDIAAALLEGSSAAGARPAASEVWFHLYRARLFFLHADPDLQLFIVRNHVEGLTFREIMDGKTN